MLYPLPWLSSTVTLQDKTEPVPDDLFQWCQSAADSNPDGVLAFCSQWAHTLSHVTLRNAGSCHPFE